MAPTKRKVTKASARSRPYREIQKPFGARTLEFVQALQLISDSLLRIRLGQIRHLATLSGQLRALLVEKSKGLKPLLLDMAHILKKDLRVYCMPGVNDPALPEHLRNEMLLHVSGFPITLERQFAAQVEIKFSELADLEILTFKGNEYTARNVIDWYANKAGGAHYSTRLPEDFAALLYANPLNIQPLASILTQIGDAVLLAGRQLIKELVDLELHAVLVVPPQDPTAIAEVNYLFDSQYTESRMRVSMFLNKRLMPTLFIQGLQGNWARLESDRLIDWSKPRHVSAVVRVDTDLSTVLELAVDGVQVGRLGVEDILFVLSDQVDFESFHNRAVDGSPQKFSFCIAHFSIYGAELSPIDAAKLSVYLHNLVQDPDLALCCYGPESYGHRPKGRRDIQMTGSVRKETIRSVLGTQ